MNVYDANKIQRRVKMLSLPSPPDRTTRPGLRVQFARDRPLDSAHLDACDSRIEGPQRHTVRPIGKSIGRLRRSQLGRHPRLHSGHPAFSDLLGLELDKPQRGLLILLRADCPFPKGVRGNNLRRVVGAFIFPPALLGNLSSYEECIKHPSRFLDGNGLTRLANAPVNGVSDPLMMFLFDRPKHFIRARANLGHTLPPTRNFLLRNSHMPLSNFRSFFYPEISITDAKRRHCR
ncbi:MAG: hypothetical protein WBA62_02515 [Xanthobacteraceae bacterium]